METGLLTRRAGSAIRHGSWTPSPGAGGAWPVAAGIGVAGVAGVLAGGGDWQLAIAAAFGPAFVVLATAVPERTALALIVALPFLFYPATIGEFSLFLAVPLFGYTSVVLLTRQTASFHRLGRVLPAIAFGILLAITVVVALLSADQAAGLSRSLYLTLFGLFAWSLAATLADGRLSRTDVAKAIVFSGALAAAAVSIQFLAQFATSTGSVRTWLFDTAPLFAGEGNVGGSNWIITDLEVIRGLFPFLAPAGAGQFLMLTLIAGVWLRRENAFRTQFGPGIELALLILIGAALLFTFSRQSWVGAVVGIVALGMRSRAAGTLGAMVIAAIMVMVLPIPGGSGSFGDYLLTAGDTSTISTSNRIDIWENAIEQIPDHAIIGVGPGLIETETISADPSRRTYAHNIFLDAALELGVPGAFALAAVLVLAIAAALRRRAELAFAMLAAYTVAGIFDDVFYFPKNGLLLAAGFALIAGSDAVSGSISPNRSNAATNPSAARTTKNGSSGTR
ncbi:MAG: O-antigen ligase family protein [Solirubrobacterales bacterium]